MNHLAHFHLAGDCEFLVVGALLGDYLKGPLDGTRPDALWRGVRLHRRIDALTDGDPAVRALRSCFVGEERRLAGIVIDVLFDYLLTRHWNHFASVPLPRFATGVCVMLEQHRDCLPAPARDQVQRIVEHRLLQRYGEVAIVDGTLEHLGARLGREAAMRAAIARAWACIDVADTVFLDFYPRLQRVAATAEFRVGISAG